jgi:heme/copper-type cytochrome/quinol oxidase subunit 1
MRRFVPAGAAVLGAVLVVAGVVVFAVANRSGAPLDFGWTAYAPLEPTVVYRSDLTLGFSDRWTVLWTGTHLLGATLVVLGLLVLAAVGGWVLGRRSGSRA